MIRLQVKGFKWIPTRLAARQKPWFRTGFWKVLEIKYAFSGCGKFVKNYFLNNGMRKSFGNVNPGICTNPERHSYLFRWCREKLRRKLHFTLHDNFLIVFFLYVLCPTVVVWCHSVAANYTRGITIPRDKYWWSYQSPWIWK